ncbi:hypothetical protein RclHR1_00550026 [Rhizophagus clarus]|uniref:Uncharacterized protein n=1 Tax=Rhizophagus clarus TaxID=94130 RepID=A0A2Z6RPA1_9GLOM|nr:hypothetical protein RclHR1_00550026 [Rhizophagus clarus]GES80224.1 hypothetical protein GLOIN_2v1834410 [Rhizophagus clarus]
MTIQRKFNLVLPSIIFITFSIFSHISNAFPINDVKQDNYSGAQDIFDFLFGTSIPTSALLLYYKFKDYRQFHIIIGIMDDLLALFTNFIIPFISLKINPTVHNRCIMKNDVVSSLIAAFIYYTICFLYRALIIRQASFKNVKFEYVFILIGAIIIYYWQVTAMVFCLLKYRCLEYWYLFDAVYFVLTIFGFIMSLSLLYYEKFLKSFRWILLSLYLFNLLYICLFYAFVNTIGPYITKLILFCVTYSLARLAMNFEPEKDDLNGEENSGENNIGMCTILKRNLKSMGTKDKIIGKTNNVRNVIKMIIISIKEVIKEINENFDINLSDHSINNIIIEDDVINENNVEERLNDIEIKVKDIKKNILRKIEEKSYEIKFEDKEKFNKLNIEFKIRSIKDDMDYINNIFDNIKKKEYFSVGFYLFSRRDGSFLEVKGRKKKKILPS